MFKTIAMLLLFLLQLTSFNAFAEELDDSLRPSANARHHHHPSPTPAPSHVHTTLHPPTKSSVHPSANAPHHHHNHNQPSSFAPTHVHTPLHPPHHAKPPAHHNHRHHPPARAPVHTLVVPTHPPLHAPVRAKPPTHGHHRPPAPARVRTPVVPSHPPLHPTPCPRNFSVVQGVVYVKSCMSARLNPLLGATKLLGAVVELQINNTKNKLFQKVKTDKSFMVVSLMQSSFSRCSKWGKAAKSSWWYHWCCS